MAGNFFRFVDALSLGCLAAILLSHCPAILRGTLAARPFLAASTAAILVAAPHILTRLLDPPSLFLSQIGNTLQALGISIFLLHGVLMPKWGVYRALNWSWVRQIGILSYSIYIWQQLVWNSPKNLGLDPVWWMGLWVLPLLALASLSYYGLERPLMRLRTFYRQKSFSAV
jgi:peptidoglycan/LPS O-acetylase OafA/YrhL